MHSAMTKGCILRPLIEYKPNDQVIVAPASFKLLVGFQSAISWGSHLTIAIKIPSPVSAIPVLQKNQVRSRQ
jgi:hypothetical protein